MAACSIPVAISRLRRDAADYIVFFSHTKHDVPSHGKVITHLNATARPDLIFPLAWHYFSIGACNLHTCRHAFCVVVVGNSTANRTTCASRAVVWALWGRFAAIFVETYGLRGNLSNLSWFHERVLLFNTKPRVMFLVLLHDRCALGPCVANRWLAIPSVNRITYDKDVGSTSEWILEDAARMDKDLRVVPLCLFGAASIIVPDAKVSDAVWSTGHCHCLGARCLMCIEPYVLSQDTVFITLQIWQSFLLTSRRQSWRRRKGCTSCLHDDPCNSVRVTVCCWAPGFHVSAPILLSITRNTNGGPTICNAILELVDRASLMFPSQALVIALSIHLNMLCSCGAESITDLDDVRVASWLAHPLCGEIGMAACSIPVAISRLRRDAADYIVFFSHTKHDVPSHGKVIAHLNAAAWPNLILPLPWHHFSIGACNLHTCINTFQVMLLCYGTTNGITCAGGAIVWALWRRFTAICIETQWQSGGLTNLSWPHKGVFLLDTKPGIMVLVLFHDFCAPGPCVANRRLAIPSIPSISHDQDVRCTTEWVLEDGTWTEKHLRVVALCLFSAAPIIIPVTKICHAFRSTGHRHRLGARNLMCIEPNVLRHHAVAIVIHHCQAKTTLVFAFGEDVVQEGLSVTKFVHQIRDFSCTHTKADANFLEIVFGQRAKRLLIGKTCFDHGHY